MSLMYSPPWYWAPYVVALGSLDWCRECLSTTPAQAVRVAKQSVKINHHLWLQRLAVLVLFFCLAVYLIRDIIAPWLASGALHPSSRELLWGSALLAWGSTLVIAALVLRAFGRGLLSLYRRGLLVLRRRAAAAAR